MAKVFILRKDGIVQRYRINSKNLREYESFLISVKYNDLIRKCRVFSSYFASGKTGLIYVSDREKRMKERELIKIKEASMHPNITNKIKFKKITEQKNVGIITTDRPLSGERIVQMHIEIRIKTPYSSQPVHADGYSLLGDAADPIQQQKMYNQALISAKNSIKSYSTDYELLKIDFIHLVKKEDIRLLG